MLSDIEQLASYAMQMNYYDYAINLTRVVAAILPFYDLIHEEEIGLPKRLDNMKVKLAQLNNSFLKKYERKIDKGRRMLPYFVDGKLRRMKDQPKFIENGAVNDMTKDNDIMKEEWMFTETCKKGKVYNSANVSDGSSRKFKVLHKNTFRLYGLVHLTC